LAQAILAQAVLPHQAALLARVALSVPTAMACRRTRLASSRRAAVGLCALLAAAACAAVPRGRAAGAAAFVPGQSGKQRPPGRGEAKGSEGTLRSRSASTGSALDDAVPEWWTEQHGTALDVLSFVFWMTAAFLAWEHYATKISAHCNGSMVLGLSGHWLPNSSPLCQLVSSSQ